MAAARFYSSTSGAIDLAVGVAPGDTSITVSTTTGLPGATPFTLVLDPGTTTEEIVEVTNVSGLTLTVTRGVDGSSATTHSAGVGNVRHMATARDFREPQEHLAASANVHGVGAGSVVGTDTAQTLTNKDLTAATNAFPASLALSADLTAHEADTSAHGVTGAVVGTTDTQTLTGKTVSGASNTLTDIPQSAVTGLTTSLSGLTAADTAMDTRVDALEADSGIITTALGSIQPNWTVNTQQLLKVGRITQVNFTFTYSGPTFTSDNGDFGNMAIGTLASQYWPILPVGLAPVASGGSVSGSLWTNGSVSLNAGQAGVFYTSGAVFSFAATYIGA